MKKKLSKIIRILGIDLNELIIDLDTSVALFNSIEWDKANNKIWLNIFDDESDIQITYDFDDLPKIDKLEIYSILSSILYN